MLVSIYTSNAELIHDDFNSITLPTPQGLITILDMHTPIIGILTQGQIILKKGKEKIEIKVDSGYFELSQNELLIIIKHTSVSDKEIEEIQHQAIRLKQKSIDTDNIQEETFKERKEASGF